MQTLTRNRGSEFANGFAETMNATEFDIIYPTLSAEVHKLLDTILEREEDKAIYCHHGLLDTPTLALGAIKTHIGRTLPKIDHPLGREMEMGDKIGTTREITDSDLFVVREVRDTGWPALLTILEPEQ